MSLLDNASLILTPNAGKEGKLYSVVPSSGAGDLDVTRATTATRVNSSGLIESVASNIPRLDYTNGSCPSILVEPQRTNIITYSSQFDNAIWQKINANGGSVPIVTANYGISPDGNQNADRIQLARTNDINSYSYIYQSFATTIGQPYTCSVWLKALSGTPSVALSLNGVYTNIATLSNEWKRYEFTANSVLNFIEATFLLYQAVPSTSLNADFLAYGFQLEVGSYATSYIPTTSASVTRNADVISKTGISSLIGQTEGTVLVDVYRPNLSSGFIFMLANSVGANAYLNSIYLYQTPTSQLSCDIFVSGVKQAGIDTSFSGISVGLNKIAIAYKQNDFVLYINGTQIGISASGNIPPLSAFEINGADIGSVSNVQTNLTALWKQRLTNSQLEQLTII
jgi:hypothetical protein